MSFIPNKSIHDTAQLSSLTGFKQSYMYMYRYIKVHVGGGGMTSRKI